MQCKSKFIEIFYDKRSSSKRFLSFYRNNICLFFSVWKPLWSHCCACEINRIAQHQIPFRINCSFKFFQRFCTLEVSSIRLKNHCFSARDEASFVSCLCNVSVAWLWNCEVGHVSYCSQMTTVRAKMVTILHKPKQRSALGNVQVFSILYKNIGSNCNFKVCL